MGAYFDQFIEVLTAAAATSTQTSKEFRRLRGATGMIAVVDVTIGDAILLDAKFQYYNEGKEAWADVSAAIPSAEGITTVSAIHIIVGPHGLAADMDMISSNNYRNIPIFEKMRIVVTHGDATEVTYAVYVQWI